ncbi:unnamed protein product [Pylaiella littoralis]
MEGLGLGASSASAAPGIFAAIVVHKGLAAFSLGCIFFSSDSSRLQFFFVMGVFSLLTPLGAAMGMLVRASSDGSSAGAGVCTALGAGTFIHIAAMEASFTARPASRYANEKHQDGVSSRRIPRLCGTVAIRLVSSQSSEGGGGGIFSKRFVFTHTPNLFRFFLGKSAAVPVPSFLHRKRLWESLASQAVTFESACDVEICMIRAGLFCF